MPQEDKEQIIRDVERHLKQGMLDRAESVYRKILSSPQVDTGLLNRIGDLYLRHGKLAESIKCCRQLAEYYETRGFEPQAAAIWKKIIKINPSEFEAHLRLGDLYQGKKLIMDAKRNYLSAGKGFLERGDSRNAIRAYEKLQELEPENLKLKEDIAGILIQLGKFDDSAQEFVNISRTLEENGNIEDAIKALRRAVSLDPKFVKETGEFIRRIFKKGMKEESVSLAEDLFLSLPERGEAGAIFGELFIELKNYSDAQKVLNKALESNPTSAYLVMKTIGRLQKEQGETAQSFEWYSKAAEDLINESDYEAAAEVMSEFLEGIPDDIRGLEKLLGIYKSLDNQEKLHTCYRRLEEAYQRVGMGDRAAFIRGEMERTAPGIDAGQKAVIGGKEAEAGQKEQKEEEEEKVVIDEEIVGPLRKEEFVDEQEALARAYSKHGMPGKAASSLEEILNRFPEEYDVAERFIEKLGAAGRKDELAVKAIELARIYDQNAKKDRAIFILRKASSFNPGDVDVAVMLEKLGEKRIIQDAAAGRPMMDRMRDDQKQAAGVEIKIEDEGESAERITTVEEMLMAFREKVKQDVPEEDYKTHYELGIAYKEMDLIDEAITEFQHARLGPNYFVDGSLMVSLCYSEKSEIENAARVLEESINEVTDETKALGLKYELAEIYSRLGKFSDSYNLFNQIVNSDPSFRDAQNRAKELLSRIK